MCAQQHFAPSELERLLAALSDRRPRVAHGACAVLEAHYVVPREQLWALLATAPPFHFSMRSFPRSRLSCEAAASSLSISGRMDVCGALATSTDFSPLLPGVGIVASGVCDNEHAVATTTNKQDNLVFIFVPRKKIGREARTRRANLQQQ